MLEVPFLTFAKLAGRTCEILAPADSDPREGLQPGSPLSVLASVYHVRELLSSEESQQVPHRVPRRSSPDDGARSGDVGRPNEVVQLQEWQIRRV